MSVGLDHDRNAIDDVEGFEVAGLTPIPALPVGPP
jgi:hypothetical protein